MCGIVGIVSKHQGGLFQKDMAMFEEMLLCDSVRGADSTGSFLVTRNTQARVLKHDTHPMNLFQTPAWEHYSKFAIREGRAVIGHNRKATQGDVNNDNAHPFYEGDIVLVHNGTIWNHKNDLKNTEVDSHAICHSFHEIGYKETLKKINGAWALVWYNTHQHKLYLTRNEDRPMSYIETHNEIIFGSEVMMIQWIAARNDKTFTREDVHVLKPFDLVTIEFNPFKRTVENIKEDVTKVFQQPQHHQHWSGGTVGDTEIDDPVTVLPRPTANYSSRSSANAETSGMELNVHPLFKVYPKDTEMIFIPIMVQEAYEDGARGKMFRAIGHAYLPGKPIVNARVMLPKDLCFSDETANDYINESKMIARLMYVSQDQDKKTWVQLTGISPDIMDITWHGIEMPATEYKYICKNFTCDKCHNKLDVSQPRLTSIMFKTFNKFKRIICDKCIQKARDKMHPDFQQALDELNAV